MVGYAGFDDVGPGDLQHLHTESADKSGHSRVGFSVGEWPPVGSCSVLSSGASEVSRDLSPNR